ncbi:transposase, partial [Faecalibacillus faecis]|nr:transposase [Faecalibacillus faecis]MCG4593876.1 transposase [Faecalibacillus faecis]
MSISKRKPKKDSMMQIINKYSHNHKACVDYFFNMKWPTGFYCEKCGCVHYYFLENRNVFECAKCGHQHYLFARTIFQDNKLPLFKLILGLYLFFSANKGCSAIEMASQLNVNYKTALKLCR